MMRTESSVIASTHSSTHNSDSPLVIIGLKVDILFYNAIINMEDNFLIAL